VTNAYALVRLLHNAEYTQWVIGPGEGWCHAMARRLPRRIAEAIHKTIK